MRGTPERPGFLLAWIALVTAGFGLAANWLLPPRPAATGAETPDAHDGLLPVHRNVSVFDPAPAPSRPLELFPGPAGSLAANCLAANLSDPFHVVGRVLDAQQQPCAGAEVWLEWPGGARSTAPVQSDQAGVFRIGPLATGGARARIQARWREFSAALDSIDLTPVQREVAVGDLQLTANFASQAAHLDSTDLSLRKQGPLPSLGADDPAAAARLSFFVARRIGSNAGADEDEAERAALRLDLKPTAHGYRLRLWFWWLLDATPDAATLDRLLTALPEPIQAALHRHFRDPRPERPSERQSDVRRRLAQVLAKAPVQAGGWRELNLELDRASAMTLLRQLAAGGRRWAEISAAQSVD